MCMAGGLCPACSPSVEHGGRAAGQGSRCLQRACPALHRSTQHRNTCTPLALRCLPAQCLPALDPQDAKALRSKQQQLESALALAQREAAALAAQLKEAKRESADVAALLASAEGRAASAEQVRCMYSLVLFPGTARLSAGSRGHSWLLLPSAKCAAQVRILASLRHRY